MDVRRFGSRPAGWRQKLHYLGYVAWVAAWTARWRPRWIYASDPLSAGAALVAGGLPGVRVVYHEHDSPAPESRTPFGRLILGTRRRLAGRAALCILPNAEREQWFRRDTGRMGPTVCVWNCPALDEVRPPRAPWAGPVLRLVYHGSIVPSRLPLTVFEALARLPSTVTLTVVGYETLGHLGYVRHLREVAEALGVGDRVEWRGAVRRADLFRWCEGADVGLALLPKSSPDRNEQSMVGASNKPFDYLACGTVPLVSDLPAWRDTYVGSGCAIACDPSDPGSLVDTIGWLARNPEQMRAMGEAGRRRVLEEWNYDRQFAPVLAWMTG
jgi:glycosyltransferase involved in cell wall biosynthesis